LSGKNKQYPGKRGKYRIESDLRWSILLPSRIGSRNVFFGTFRFRCNWSYPD
jgi:hypothetical protein